MSTFYDVTTDSLQSDFHNSIEWSVQYNRIVGSCPDTPLFRQVVPSAYASALKGCVVVHEMVHLLERSHGERFVSFDK